MVEGTINGFPIQTALEPDGQGSHWFKAEEQMLKTAKLAVGDNVKLQIKPSKVWPEPEIPQDLKNALANSPKVQNLWKKVTPMARWDWLRWINSTKNPQTRQKRIKVTLSKLKSGLKRPCCFNRTLCTEPSVSHNGILLESAA